MKKRATKRKDAAKRKPRAAKAAKAARKSAYTPPPLKSDGWPPFRYPLT